MQYGFIWRYEKWFMIHLKHLVVQRAAWDELEVRWKGRLHPPFSDEVMLNIIVIIFWFILDTYLWKKSLHIYFKVFLENRIVSSICNVGSQKKKYFQCLDNLQHLAILYKIKLSSPKSHITFHYFAYVLNNCGGLSAEVTWPHSLRIRFLEPQNRVEIS